MWHLWIEKKALELLDPLLESSYSIDEAMKLIKIGLLCVQENVEERPTMSLVIHMLRSSDHTVFPTPTQPPSFITRPRNVQLIVSSSSSHSHAAGVPSVNDVTNSDLLPR